MKFRIQFLSKEKNKKDAPTKTHFEVIEADTKEAAAIALNEKYGDSRDIYIQKNLLCFEDQPSRQSVRNLFGL